ncbi:MAG: Ig-like domain-containing protein [Lachnospiraceae bacterium]|nr:Ig-like domain-containing protein [Lachnospiraceae bacterium]
MAKGKRLKIRLLSWLLIAVMFCDTFMSSGPLVVFAEDTNTTQTNLVINGDFSSGEETAASITKDSVSTTIGGWAVANTSVVPMDFAIADGALTISETATTGSSVLQQKISLEKGKTYIFSVNVKPVDIQTASGKAYVQLNTNVNSCKFSDTNGKTKIAYLEDAENALKENEWNTIQGEFTPTDNVSSKNFQIRFCNISDGYWLVDNISIVEKDATDAVNAFSDGGFTGMAGTKITSDTSSTSTALGEKWKCIGKYDDSTASSDFEILTVTENDTSTEVLKISKTPFDGIVTISRSDLSLVTGGTYTFSVDVTTSDIVSKSDTEEAYVTVTAGGESVTQKVSELTDGKITGEITIPENAADLTGFSVSMGNFMGGSFTVDNIALYRKEDSGNTETIEPTLSVTPSEVNVKQGESTELTVSVYDPSTVVTDIIWTSSVEGVTISKDISDFKKAIVTVADTIVADTTVTITATAVRSDDGAAVTGTCTLTVEAADPVISNFVTNGDFELGLGSQLIEFKTATNTDITLNGELSGWRGYWTSDSNNAAANYEIVANEGRNGSQAMKLWRTAPEGNTDALITSVLQSGIGGLEVGENYIFTAYVKAVGVNSDATCRLQVKNQDNTEFKGSKIPVSDFAEEEWKEYTYEFTAGSDSKKGRVMFQVAGVTTGYWLFDDISLVKKPTEPTITLDKESINLELGKTSSLTVTLSDPDNVLMNESNIILWSSDDETVATVDENGVVTAKRVGTAYIKASIAEGKYMAQCKIAVTEPVIALAGISMTESSLSLTSGAQKTLEAILTPADATETITWTSSDESVVQVTADSTAANKAVVTAMKEGTATITAAASSNPEVKAECTVTVTASSALITSTVSLETDFGTTISLDKENGLTKYITNNTGENVTFKLYEAPTRGYMEVAEDGSLVYAPGIIPDTAAEFKGDGAIGGTYTFKVLIMAGEETALIDGTVTVKPLSELLNNISTDGSLKLFFSEDALNEAKEAIQEEGSLKNRLYVDFIEAVELFLDTTPPAYTDYTDSQNDQCSWQQKFAEMTKSLLAAYLFTDDVRYKEKCIEYAVAIAEYDYWAAKASYHEGDLSASYNAYALALVYNWLKDDLTVEQRTTILNRLYYASQCIYYRRWYRNRDGGMYCNTSYIFSSAILATTLALYMDADYASTVLKIDEDMRTYALELLAGKENPTPDNIEKNFETSISAEDLKSDCKALLTWVMDDLGQSYYWLPDDGVSFESPAYNIYGGYHLLHASLMLESDLGIDVFTGNSYYQNNSEFFLNNLVPLDSFTVGNYFLDWADTRRGVDNPGEVEIYSILASKYNDKIASYIVDAYLNAEAGDPDCFWIPIIFVENEVEPAIEENKDTLWYSENLGMVISRSDWSGNESLLWAKCGLPMGKNANSLMPLGASEYHADPDANSLILYANGEFLIKTDGYGYKHTGNLSTLLINGTGQIGEHEKNLAGEGNGNRGLIGDDYTELGLEPTMTVIESTDSYDYFVGAGEEAYDPALLLNKFERNFVYLKEENVLLIVDDIKTGTDQALELRWFPESKTVVESYGIYSVYGTNTVMNFYPFTTENVTTSFTDADVFEPEDIVATTEKAFLQSYTGSKWQNAVAFSWAPNGEAQKQVKYQVGDNANEHIFEVNGKLYTLNVADNTLNVSEGSLNQTNEYASDSALSTILFNGEAMEGFDSETTEYTLERFWKTIEVEILPIASAPTAKVTTDWNGECPGTVTITCTSEDESSTTIYTLNLTNDNGMLGIASASANPDDMGRDITHTYDNYVAPDGSTKTWATASSATTGKAALNYDMGQLVDITKIDVAFNASSIRGSYYDLEVSEDGEIWTTIQEGYKSEQTAADGPYNDYRTIYTGEALRARYVRLILRGNDYKNNYIDKPGTTCSIQEISIYGKYVVASIDGTKYASLEDAMENANDGDTITLLDDIVYNKQLAIGKGITLDLNGKTLTASGAATFGGYVVDNSDDKTGLLKVAEDQFKFITETNNPQMPVYNGKDGYVFATIKPQETFSSEGAGDSTLYNLIFRPYFGSETTIQNALSIDGNDIEDQFSVIIRLTWKEGTEQKTQDLVYTDAMVQQVYDNKKAFYINASGVTSFEGLTITPMVISKVNGVAWSGNSFPGSTITE